MNLSKRRVGWLAVPPTVDTDALVVLWALGHRVGEAAALLAGVDGDSMEERVPEALQRAARDQG